MSVLVSDKERSTAYHKAFDATGSQAIAMVHVFIDKHPYTTQNPSTGQSMDPVDANGFNSSTEWAVLTIDTQNLAPGQHILYIEVEDSAGFKGAILVAFFNI